MLSAGGRILEQAQANVALNGSPLRVVHSLGVPLYLLLVGRAATVAPRAERIG